MSDTAIHGSKQYVEIEDPDNPGDFIDISAKCSSFNPNVSRQNVPTPGFGEGDVMSIVGMRDGQSGLQAYMDQELRDILWGWFLNQDTPCLVNYGPEGNGTGKEKQTNSYWVLGFGDGGDVNSAIGTAPTLQRTGATVRDVWA